MAVRGTCKVFNETMKRFAEGEIDLSSDVLKLAIVDDTLIPATDDTTPTWSDYSANEVVSTGNYTAGGETLTTVVSAMVSGIYTLTADDVNIAIHASGFTDGAYGILIDTTATGTPALGFVQLEGRSISNGRAAWCLSCPPMQQLGIHRRGGLRCRLEQISQ
jgi:hypothetical protein